jgi:predicted N-acetyltransferase YhbS
MVTIRPELPGDTQSREALLDRAFGRKRQRKTSQRLRDGRMPADGLSFSAVAGTGKLVGTIRLWHIQAGGAGAALLLGPIAVDAKHQGCGIGRALIARAIENARALGHSAIVLVGDLPYYQRFGFGRLPIDGLRLPGPVDPDRLLGLELKPNALQGAAGLVSASGTLISASGQRLRATA